MPVYMRKINDRILLVRPTKWRAAEELTLYDCLDITEARKHTTLFRKNWDILDPPITAEIQKNYHLYRSVPFTKEHADNPRMNNPFFGCCVVATEALYFLTPDDMEPTCHKALDGDGIYHWWLECKDSHSGEIIILDATHHQFDDLSFNPPYEKGKKTSLMGWKQSPSKRTLDLIENTTGTSRRYRSLLPFYAPPDAPGNLEKFMSD